MGKSKNNGHCFYREKRKKKKEELYLGAELQYLLFPVLTLCPLLLPS